jgi:hypothetical protein
LRKFFILSHDLARINAKQAINEAPAGYSVKVEPVTRSLEQNAKLHALLSDISKLLEWAGKKRDVETWKRLLVAAWLRARGEPLEMLPAIDGHGVDIVFRRTSELTISEMIELIEYIQSWAIDSGVNLDH